MSALRALSPCVGQSCPPPPEQVPRRYHPRPVFRVGDQTSTEVAWYASTVAPTPSDGLPDGLGALSMNAHGDVVGTFILSVGGVDVPRPFLWLQSANFGLAPGVYDLLTKVNPNGPLTAIGYAWDISDGGIVVGGTGGRPDRSGPPCRATARDLTSLGPNGSNPLVQLPLDPTSAQNPSPYLWSMALAIEPIPDAPHPIEIVGTGAQACYAWRKPAHFEIGAPLAAQLPWDQPGFSNYDGNHTQSLRQWACDITNGRKPAVGSYDSPESDIPLPPNPEKCPGVPIDSLICSSAMIVGAAFKVSPTTFYRRVSDPDVDAMNAQWTGVRSISRDGQKLAGYVKPSSGGRPNTASTWNYTDPNNAQLLPYVDGYSKGRRNVGATSHRRAAPKSSLGGRWP
ncbi:MAG: hypothetical protein SGJ09_16155 [Phycisphaerae bacterium]|nr:hypothetical protein [Phycisphaerae bacterium]